MALLKKLIQGAAAIIFLVALAWGGWTLLDGLIDLLSTLESTLAVAVVGGFVAVFGYLYTQWQTKNRDIAEAHRLQKIEVYNLFFDILEKVLLGVKQQPLVAGKPPKELQKLFTKFTRGLVTWGSPNVIQKWSKFQAEGSQKEGKEVLYLMDDLLKAIRKDLGNSDFGLKRGAIIALFLSDPEKLL